MKKQWLSAQTIFIETETVMRSFAFADYQKLQNSIFSNFSKVPSNYVVMKKGFQNHDFLWLSTKFNTESLGSKCFPTSWMTYLPSTARLLRWFRMQNMLEPNFSSVCNMCLARQLPYERQWSTIKHSNTIKCKKLTMTVLGQKYVAGPFIRHKQVSTSSEM